MSSKDEGNKLGVLALVPINMVHQHFSRPPTFQEHSSSLKGLELFHKLTFWPTPDRGFQSCACHTTGMFLPMRSLQCFKSKPLHAAAGAIKRLANCTARCHPPKPNPLFFIVYRSDVQRDRVNKLFFCNKGTRNTEDVEVYDKQSRIGWIKDRCIVSSREQRCASSFTSSHDT